MNALQLDILDRKRQFIRTELKVLDKLLGIKATKHSDEVLDRAVCHTVQNIIAAIIDSAQHIVVEKSAQVPGSYAQALEHLGQLGILDSAFAAQLANAAKLRNVVVHAYENLKMDLVWEAAKKLRQDALTYEKAIAKVS